MAIAGKINPMFSPKMAALYLLMIMAGAIIIDGAESVITVIIGSAILVSGMIGCFYTIVRNR